MRHAALERPAGLLFDNGLGGFSADGREYVIHLGPGDDDTGPVVQRPGERGLRHAGHGVRRWLHLGGEQRRASPHAVDERPGERPARRGAVRSRRGNGGRVDADAPARRSRRGAHEIRYGAGYAPLALGEPWAVTGTARVRGAGRSREGHSASRTQSPAPPPAA